MHKIGSGLFAVAALIAAAMPATAQDYPTRPIKMVVPFPPGGPSDVVARIIADGMSRALGGESVIIENVGGAGGTLGTARVAEAAPDGYTVLAAGMGSHVAAPAFYTKMRYDSTKDFEPIGLAANSAVAIVAKKDLPAGNLQEFIAWAKKEGDHARQGHGGIGSASHMACLLFNTQAGLHPTPVAYRGTGPALNDLIGSHIDYFCEQVLSVAPAVTGGTIKAFAVSGDARSPALPDIPSAKEAGLPDYKINIWSAVFAPKGTPKPILAKLSAALDKALDDPAVVKRLTDLGGTIPPKAERGPDHLEQVLKADIARWDPILKQAMAESKKANETAK
jgi:tripartite-type tricarboxylate transporter receptor subunit TctC